MPSNLSRPLTDLTLGEFAVSFLVLMLAARGLIWLAEKWLGRRDE